MSHHRSSPYEPEIKGHDDEPKTKRVVKDPPKKTPAPKKTAAKKKAAKKVAKKRR
jgi:hypothetical protein